MLAPLTKGDRTGISLRRETRGINGASSTELVSLLQEINDLYLLGVVYGDLSWLSRSGNIIPATIEVIGVGKVLHEPMELQQIPDEDLDPLITLLQ
jgi:hypothetical protein